MMPKDPEDIQFAAFVGVIVVGVGLLVWWAMPASHDDWLISEYRCTLVEEGSFQPKPVTATVDGRDFTVTPEPYHRRVYLCEDGVVRVSRDD